RTEASSMCFGSRGLALLVPTQTSPPETTGLEMLRSPRTASHLTLARAAGSTDQRTGARFSGLTALRLAVRPAIGQSAAAARGASSKTAAPTAAQQREEVLIAGLQADSSRPCLDSTPRRLALHHFPPA